MKDENQMAQDRRPAAVGSGAAVMGVNLMDKRIALIQTFSSCVVVRSHTRGIIRRP